MKRVLRPSSAWAWAAAAVALSAAPLAALDVREAIAGIEARYNRPRTMQLDFEQTYTGYGRPPRTERGVLYLRKPRRMRWEYEQPPGKLFLSDGKFVYFYSPAANRVEKMPLKQSGDLRTPLAFLMGRLDLRRDFREFRSRPEGEDLHVVALPKSKNAPYREVVFVVTPEFRIKRLVVRGSDESVMEFRFSNERINPPLPADLFVFRAPAGVEFIEVGAEEGAGN